MLIVPAFHIYVVRHPNGQKIQIPPCFVPAPASVFSILEEALSCISSFNIKVSDIDNPDTFLHNCFIRARLTFFLALRKILFFGMICFLKNLPVCLSAVFSQILIPLSKKKKSVNTNCLQRK